MPHASPLIKLNPCEMRSKILYVVLKVDRRSNPRNRASDRHIALRLNGNRFVANALPRVNQNKNTHSLKWLRPLSAPKACPNMFHDTFDLAKLPSMPNNWDRT